MTMTEAGQEPVTIKNFFVGKVWLCSGKSSMRMSRGIFKVKKTYFCGCVYYREC